MIVIKLTTTWFGRHDENNESQLERKKGHEMDIWKSIMNGTQGFIDVDRNDDFYFTI